MLFALNACFRYKSSQPTRFHPNYAHFQLYQLQLTLNTELSMHTHSLICTLTRIHTHPHTIHTLLRCMVLQKCFVLSIFQIKQKLLLALLCVPVCLYLRFLTQSLPISQNVNFRAYGKHEGRLACTLKCACARACTTTRSRSHAHYTPKNYCYA